MSTVPLGQWLAHRPRRGATVDTVVLHATGVDDCDSCLCELREKGLSYHYLIDRDGIVHKCVPYSAVAFHAGNSYGPHEQSRGTPADQDSHHNFVEMTSVNEYSVGVCFVNRDDGLDCVTQEQFDACVAVLQDLRTGLPKLRYVTTHAIVSPGRVTDPCAIDPESVARRVGLEVWRP